MKINQIRVSVLGFLLLLTAFPGIGRTAVGMPGGYYDVPVTDARVIGAADFAIKAEAIVMPARKKAAQPATLTLVKILSAQQQVVAGMNYRLRLKVIANNVAKEAETVVYQKLSGEYELTSWEWR